MRVLPYELSQTRECFQSGEPISDLSVASVGISPRDVAQVRTRRALLTTSFPPCTVSPPKTRIHTQLPVSDLSWLNQLVILKRVLLGRRITSHAGTALRQVCHS